MHPGLVIVFVMKPTNERIFLNPNIFPSNPARAENDLLDPNDYDIQYCMLGPALHPKSLSQSKPTRGSINFQIPN